ncbi:hypothetical protein [Curtobacterium oceanosedimentum]|uniref:hypothetical protein n=1 Tax=Curtobacterium oceanosedimentum TaxID=465820 RepID=UPI001AE7FCB8
MYEVLAVLAYLLDSVPSNVDWQVRTAELLSAFPAVDGIDVASMGLVPARLDEPIWSRRRGDVGPVSP